MAGTNTDFVVRTYIDDFNRSWNNIPFKIQEDAPKLDLIYDDRPSALTCGGNLPFSMRYLVVTFNDGRKLRYPVSRTSEIVTVATILKPSLLDNAIPGLGDDEAACIELVGEKWNILTPSAIGNLTYRSNPFTNIPNRGLKETGNYLYESDIPGVGDLRLGYRIEKLNSDLLSCQKNGLKAASTNKAICSTGGTDLKPRHLILKAVFQQGSKQKSVVRNIITSERSSLKTVASSSSDCAYCFGYQGESVKEIAKFVGNTIAG